MTAIANATDRSTVELLTQAVEDLQQTVEQQAERIDKLETELQNYREHNEHDKATIRQDVTDNTERIDTVRDENRQPEVGSPDQTPGTQGGGQDVRDEQTPLETICSLPEHVAARELSANQERARFIARDIEDYAEKAPAGLVINSRAIKRVLTAKEGDRPHTQTVARVMDFLDRLGKDDVEQTKRRGRKLVAVDPEAADRYAHHDRCDRKSGPATGGSVIRSA